jgi:hypothetical protein
VITPTDLHRIPGVHTDGGGHEYRDGIAWPIEDQRDEHALNAEPQPDVPDPFWFGIVAVLRIAPLVFVVVALGTFFILDVLKGKP